MSVLSELATEIFETEFDSDSDVVTEVKIEAWLEANLGKLNILLESCYEGSDPVWSGEEPDIYKLMYLKDFYTKKAAKTLRGIDGGIDFITVKEGDTVITKTNKNEVAKTYRGLAKDAGDELEDLVDKYRRYNSQPVDVIPDY